MIKTIASLFTIYGISYSQIPPIPNQAIPVQLPPVIPPIAPQTTAMQSPPVQPQTTATQTVTAPPLIPPLIPPLQPQTTAMQAPPVQVPPVQVPPMQQPQTTLPAQVPPVQAPPSNPQWVPVTTAGAVQQPPISVPVVTAPPVPQAPAGEFFGFYGQLCPIPPPDGICQPVMPSFGGNAIEQVPGFTKCERVGDCCGCSSITCGNAFSGCNTFSAGDYGAFGNQHINVVGEQQGAQILCIGLNGCANSVINAQFVKSIDADKEGSMKYAKVTVTEPVDGFALDCIGKSSCEGMEIEIVIPGPPEGFMCNPAYIGQTVEYNSLSCYGQDSCKNMKLTVNNQGCNPVEFQHLECYAPTACVGASFNFKGRSPITVNQCDIIGSSAGVATGLAQICGLSMPGQGQGQQQPNPAWLPQV